MAFNPSKTIPIAGTTARIQTLAGLEFFRRASESECLPDETAEAKEQPIRLWPARPEASTTVRGESEFRAF